MSANLSIVPESFDSLSAFYADCTSGLKWDLVFTLPAWLSVWWDYFGSEADLYLRSVKEDGRTIGVAPLQIRGGTASIIGSLDVCDYLDLVSMPGKEAPFLNALLDDLSQKGITRLNLEPLRPDSTVLTHLVPLARDCGYPVYHSQVDVSIDMELPEDWEQYLQRLDRKQRHELRRKMRNLQKLGETTYRCIEENSVIPEAADSFLKLFPESREDKAAFMTDEMEAFFRSLSRSLAEAGIIRYGVLETAGIILAMVMYFDYNGCIYLYNSSYDPEYKSHSVGLISKARCIQDGIQKSKKRFDFLKGPEQYKYYLGGREVPLYNCQVVIGRGN